MLYLVPQGAGAWQGAEITSDDGDGSSVGADIGVIYSENPNIKKATALIVGGYNPFSHDTAQGVRDDFSVWEYPSLASVQDVVNDSTVISEAVSDTAHATDQAS